MAKKYTEPNALKKLMLSFSVYLLALILINILAQNTKINYSTKFIESSLIITSSGIIISLINFVGSAIIWPKALSTKTKLDNELFPVVEKSIKWLVVIISALLVARNLGANLDSVLTGFGIGGIAIAIASKSVLENFFGAITIFSDNIFETGDYVKIIEGPATQTEGYIKKIGLRSTRIIGKTGEEVIIPNSALLSAFVTNYKRRTKRNTDWIFYLASGSPVDSIQKAKEIITNALNDASLIGIDSKYTVVALKDTDPQFIKIHAHFIITIKDYRDSLRLRDKIHTDILQRLEDENITLGKQS